MDFINTVLYAFQRSTGVEFNKLMIGF